jgi:hypothetical protein
MNEYKFNRNALQVSRGANVSVCLATKHYSEHSDVKRDCLVCSDRSHGKRVDHACVFYYITFI